MEQQISNGFEKHLETRGPGYVQCIIYHLTYALCDTPFVTYINSYMFRPRGAILRKVYKPT